MTGSVRAELLLLRKRRATWILLMLWLLLVGLFSYLFPYLSYTGQFVRRGGQASLASLLPQNLVSTLLVSFPFYGGVFALILAVLVFGSEYGWGTLKTVFTQRPVRLKIVAAKLIALAVVLTPFVVLLFGFGALASVIIAKREAAAIVWPSLGDLLQAGVVAWFILAAWATLGVFLAVWFRGTTLAISLGIVYGLLIEGIVTAFGRNVAFLQQASNYFLRTNAYSLIAALGVKVGGEDGPGTFQGPVMSETHSILVLAGFIAVSLAIAALLMNRRDVS